jgi:hypothetical protein
MKSRLTCFAFLLPASSLVFWCALVLVPASLYFLQLKHSANGSGSVSLALGQFVIHIPPDRFFSFALERSASRHSSTILVIDAPGLFLNAMASWALAGSARWIPPFFMREAWFAIVWPFCALPAWFLVGRGVDGLLTRNRVRLGEMTLSLSLAAIMTALSLGLRFGTSPAERQEQYMLNPVIEGLGLWSLLILAPFAAWLRQRRQNTGAERNSTT